jgi:long-chain acyl-CoA synthetase
MRIMKDDGTLAKVGERGEIQIFGPQVMLGYWNKPEETVKVLDGEHWFSSGDIGVMDHKGFFTIVDRKKDMIIVSGFNVYPNEIEDFITTNP